MTEPIRIPETYDQIYGWVASRYGQAQVALFQPSFESVKERLDFADHNLQQVESLMTDATQHLHPLEPFLWLTGARSANTAKLQEAMTLSRVYVLASLQNTHAPADLLTHAVYYGTGMNLDKATMLEERRIMAFELAKRIRVQAIEVPFKALLDHDDYRYLADLTNHFKHRSGIPTSVEINLLRGARPELFFHAFEQASRRHAKRPVVPFLRHEHRRVVEAATRTVQALIEHLKVDRRMLKGSGIRHMSVFRRQISTAYTILLATASDLK